MQTEVQLLESLKAGDKKAYERLKSVCEEQLVEYCMVLMHDLNRGKQIVNGLFTKWKAEKFVRATSPISKWMMTQIDIECSVILQLMN